MNLKHEFNRIGHLINGGLGKTQHQASEWADTGGKQACKLSRQMRSRAQTGARSAMDVEEAVVRHVRGNPSLYLLAAGFLIAILLTKLFIESRRAENAPLL